MEIIIKIENGKVEIILKESQRIIDKAAFFDEHNLTEKLLPEINKILKKNKLEIGEIRKASLNSSVEGSYTTVRIAKTVVDAINWAISQKKNG